MYKLLIVIICLTQLTISVSFAADLKLTRMFVKSHLIAGVPYDVSFCYSGDSEGVSEVCLLWSGEGPYCWSDFRVDKSAKLIRTRARTGNPATYTLSGFIRYGGGQTNVVSATINVKPTN